MGVGPQVLASIVAAAQVAAEARDIAREAMAREIPVAINGEDGRGITGFERISGDGSAGTTDVYRVSYSREPFEQTIEIVNGRDGIDGDDGDDGVSVLGMSLVSGEAVPGGEQVFEFKYSNGKSDRFTVIHGANGEPGASVKGDKGDKGWSPQLASMIDGERRVLQVKDWTGGQGEKPQAGQYIGALGLVNDIADAVDVRGGAGAKGDLGPMPKHQWDGTKIRFEKSPGKWGQWTDLKPDVGSGGGAGNYIIERVTNNIQAQVTALAFRQSDGHLILTLSDGSTIDAGAAIVPFDDYSGSEYLPDQPSTGSVLTFTFTGGPVQQVWIELTSNTDTDVARVRADGADPTANTGVKIHAGQAQPMTVTTSSLKVLAPSGTTVSVYGFRR